MLVAVRLGSSTSAIFDAFPDEDARQAHLAGKVGQALNERAEDLFEPITEHLDVIAEKRPR